MATHSSILAWRIPWTEESGGLQSMGLQRVGHDIATDIFFHCIHLIFLFGPHMSGQRAQKGRQDNLETKANVQCEMIQEEIKFPQRLNK